LDFAILKWRVWVRFEAKSLAKMGTFEKREPYGSAKPPLFRRHCPETVLRKLETDKDRCGCRMAGSPFTVNASSSATTNSDASKLIVSGPGIKHGLLNAFCSYFSIDTTEAGFGQLNVTVRGPKGRSTRHVTYHAFSFQ